VAAEGRQVVNVGAVIFVLVAAAAMAAYGGWRIRRRLRRVRRLENAEASVAHSLAEGRLSRATGEALLQHLEGLRRESTGRNGS
jgi:hypothetical protein